MTRELIESWLDYQTAVDRLLALATRQFFVYDEDLAHVGLEETKRLEALGKLLASPGDHPLRIAVRNAERFNRHSPRLQQLLTPWAHRAEVRQTPATLASLRDGMLIADGRHALIRLEKELPRSVLLIDDSVAVAAYLTRFEEIWHSSRKNLLQNPLGL